MSRRVLVLLCACALALTDSSHAQPDPEALYQESMLLLELEIDENFNSTAMAPSPTPPAPQGTISPSILQRATGEGIGAVRDIVGGTAGVLSRGVGDVLTAVPSLIVPGRSGDQVAAGVVAPEVWQQWKVRFPREGLVRGPEGLAGDRWTLERRYRISGVTPLLKNHPVLVARYQTGADEQTRGRSIAIVFLKEAGAKSWDRLVAHYQKHDEDGKHLQTLTTQALMYVQDEQWDVLVSDPGIIVGVYGTRDRDGAVKILEDLLQRKLPELKWS